MKTAYLLLLGAFSSISPLSCKKGGKCEEAIDIKYDSFIEIIFKDSITNKYLYTSVNSLYNIDSLKISSVSGDSIYLVKGLGYDAENNGNYLGIGFGGIFDPITDKSSFSSELCKNFIVRYAYNEIDTITTCFKSRYTECGAIFETFKVYNKGTLLNSKTDAVYLAVTITKK